MPNSSPAWVRQVQVAVTVNNVPVIPEAATETPAGGAGNHSGTETDYQTVESWTVTAEKIGELKEILIISSNYAKTLIEIVIGSLTWCTDWSPQGAMPVIFEDLQLAAETIVTVKAKSSDGTTIDVDAIIAAKEIA